MDQLCLEVLEQIFQLLHEDDLKRLSLVCRQFYYGALKLRWKGKRFWPVVRVQRLTEIGKLPIQSLHSMDFIEYSQGNYETANMVIRQIESLKTLYLDHYGTVSKIDDILDLNCHLMIFASMVGGWTADALKNIDCTITFEGFPLYHWTVEELKLLIGVNIELLDFGHLSLNGGYDNPSLFGVVKELRPKMVKIERLLDCARFLPEDFKELSGI